MKSKFLLSILAAIPAALMPLAAAGQIAPERAPAERTAPSFKYEAYALFSYTSLNQVNTSRYGLIGAKFGVTRDWGKYFGLTGMATYYRVPSSSSSPGNPGDPLVYGVYAGPEVHANLYGNFSGLVHGLLGVEHTGGEGMTPNLSFSGGFGGGLTYDLNKHLALRASGDRIAQSFSLINNTPALAYSPHKTWNAQGDFGVIYRF